MKKIQGTHIHLGTVDTDGTFSAFAFARQASVSMKRNMIQIASPTTGDSEEYIPGRKSWQMDCGCLLSNDESAVINAYNAGTKLKFAFRDETPDWSPELKYAFNGYGYIGAIKQQANIHNMASFNVSLQGTGPLTYDLWDGGITEIKIKKVQDFATLSQFTITSGTVPCDVIIKYKAGKTGARDFLIKKGNSLNALITLSSIGYEFSDWTVEKSVANYTFNLVNI